MGSCLFRACQAMDRCPQHPGIYSTQHFWIELFINLLLCIRWVCRCLETKLKKFALRAIERKSERWFSEELLTLGIYIYMYICLLSTLSLNENFLSFKTSLKNFKNKFGYFWPLFVNLWFTNLMYTIKTRCRGISMYQ